MASLSVQGDPQGWADLGAAFGTAAATLESELSNADVNGAQALTRSWYGPTAAAFSASWAGRRSRYEQLINNLSSAGRAIGGYAQRLEELQGQAWSLESKAIEAGLRVTPLGDGFMIPPEIGLLPAPARMVIEHALNDVAQGVERLFADIAAAAEDLLFTLGPVATLLEDFFLAGVGSALLSEFVHEFVSEIRDDLPFSPVDLVSGFLRVAANTAEQDAAFIRNMSARGWTEFDALVPGADAAAGRAAGLADGVDHASILLTAVVTTGQVAWGAFVDHQGVRGSIEAHAGDIADAAVGIGLGVVAAPVVASLIVAGAPEALVVVGSVVVTSVVAAGVGAAVQTIVDHRHAIIHAADSAVHDVESIF